MKLLLIFFFRSCSCHWYSLSRYIICMSLFTISRIARVHTFTGWRSSFSLSSCSRLARCTSHSPCLTMLFQDLRFPPKAAPPSPSPSFCLSPIHQIGSDWTLRRPRQSVFNHTLHLTCAKTVSVNAWRRDFIIRRYDSVICLFVCSRNATGYACTYPRIKKELTTRSVMILKGVDLSLISCPPSWSLLHGRQVYVEHFRILGCSAITS